ncbi:MAG: guanylate kinase [Elusimicrobiales bacterium]|jgi:guanylate kinase|nr:guanylate kinase [Elusimicrobiales bacterium]
MSNLVVLSSPSGGGKTALKNELLKNNDIFRFSITATTRSKRENEVDGRDYYFVTDNEFDELIKNGELLEWATVHNHRYGTPKKSVMNILLENKIPIMTIDVAGAMSVRKVFNNSTLIFILPPDVNTLIERLKLRGESVEEINIRLKTALKEINFIPEFDYLVINDKIDKAAERINNIVIGNSPDRCEKDMQFVSNFKKQLESILLNGGVK